MSQSVIGDVREETASYPPWLSAGKADRLAAEGVCFWSASDRPAWYRLRIGTRAGSGLRIVTLDSSPVADSSPASSDVQRARDVISRPRILMGVSAAVYTQPVVDSVPLVVHRDRIVLGPRLNTPDGPCPACVFCRFGSTFYRAAAYLDLARASRRSPAVWRRQQIAAQTALAGIADGIESLVEELLELPAGYFFQAPFAAQAAWRRELLPPLPHPPGHGLRDDVLPLVPPARWPCRPTGDLPADGFSPAVGPLFGSRQLAPRPREPRAIEMSLVQVANLGAFLTWPPDEAGTGVAFSSPAAAQAAARGEAVERYCGNAAPPGRLRASPAMLRSAGLSHRPPAQWALFAPAQYAHATFPLLPMSEERAIGWVTARDLAGTRAELVPAAAVWLNYRPRQAEPRCFPVGLAGIAAGRSHGDAIRSALLELIERDAATLWWLAGLGATECVIPATTSLHQQLTAGSCGAIRQWWLSLPTDLPAHVIAGCLHDQRLDILTVGFAARLDLTEAIRKAAAEAWQLHRISCDLLDPASTLWRAHADGSIRARLTPYRPDRSYRDAFQQDFSDITQLLFHAQYYLDRRTQEAALNRLTGVQAVQVADLEADSGRFIATSEAELVDAMTQIDSSLFEVDVTSSDMRRAHWRVLRVGSTFLCGNMPAAFPLLGNLRLRRAIELSASGFYPQPCPHA